MKSFPYFTVIIITVTLTFNLSFAQVKVDVSKSIVDVVKSLEGPGVQISNISWYSPSGSPTPSIAYFEDLTNHTGIDKGILITTGGAKLAEGPNDFGGTDQENYSYTMSDPDLNQYSIYPLFDISYVQFDIVLSSSVLTFEYVFASEEYPEYSNSQFSDVFALMISGPGIIGRRNLAIVPGTTLPVSIYNLNHNTNSAYYRDNYQNPFLEYDGLTVPLVASTNVIPCETYRIKLAIADASDPWWDSGVFIRKGSFKSEEPPVVSITYENPDLNSVIESCNRVTLKVERPAGMSNTTESIYLITVSGTAVNGIDYTLIPDSIKILAGETTTFLEISSIVDNKIEGEETLWIRVGNECATPLLITINDLFPYFIPSEAVCLGETVQINPTPEPGTTIVWETNDHLSCTNCLSPDIFADTTNYYYYTITHDASGCTANDSVLVEVVKIVPDFTYYSDPCYTSSDITFINNTSIANQYLWDFGDGETSTDANPSHSYLINDTRSAVQYTVKLTANSSSPIRCSEQTTETIVISDPLFIPNLLTADNNEKNEEFKISGIGGECWTLYLYNRWGGLVYKKENYTDEFKGSEVEAGNYYYLLENDNKDRSFSGWIHIIGNSQ